MSLLESSKGNVQEEPKTRLQEDEETRQSEPEDQDKNTTTKGLKIDRRSAVSPLDLLKEDFSQFKDGVLNVFKDKDTKTELDGWTWSYTGNKQASSTFSLLKDDLNQFKEDVTSVFSISLSKDKETKVKHEDGPSNPTENVSRSTINLLKDDLNQIKEDVTSVFSLSLSKDKETKTQNQDLPLSQTENNPSRRTLALLKDDLNQFKDDVTSVFSLSLSKDKETKVKHEDGPSNPTENVSRSTINLLKEDLNQFKEDVTSVFSISLSKDKETKTQNQDLPLSQTENNPSCRTLALLKDDLNPFKEDVTSVFSISLSKDKETNLEKTISSLSSLKDELSSVSLPKEEDASTEESSNTFEKKALKAERTDEPLKTLLRRGQQTSKKTFSETSEEQMDRGFRGHPLEQKEETEEEPDVLEISNFFSVVSVDHKVINTEEEEEKTPPWQSLSSGISLFSLRDKHETRDQPGDELWSVKNCACYLTFDPNTANSELRLTDGNRKATRKWSDQQILDHPDRFDRCPQVLCREGLLDSAYWEVVWSGGADIGVSYNSISRGGDVASCLLGHNGQSWSLECSEGSYTPCHNKRRFRSSSPRPFTHRVGVFLDWSAGSLSFYCVSQDSMVHLHTFTSTFTQPLYPAFWVWFYDGSVALCHVELDWERLLQ